MAATVQHARDSSIASFDRDASYSFPARTSTDRPLSTGYRFPPQYASNEPYAFPGRRGSVPIMGSVITSINSSRPRSTQADALKQLSANSSRDSSPESRDYVTSVARTSGSSSTYNSASRASRTLGDNVQPTILNASVRSHTRDVSELLQVPMLDSQIENRDPVAPVVSKRAPPPPGVNIRRGHAHRRSGAISSSDVWSLMKESAPPPPIPTIPTMAPEDSARLSPKASPRLSWNAPVSPGLLPGEQIMKWGLVCVLIAI